MNDSYSVIIYIDDNRDPTGSRHCKQDEPVVDSVLKGFHVPAEIRLPLDLAYVSEIEIANRFDLSN